MEVGTWLFHYVERHVRLQPGIYFVSTCKTGVPAFHPIEIVIVKLEIECTEETVFEIVVYLYKFPTAKGVIRGKDVGGFNEKNKEEKESIFHNIWFV